MFNPRVMICKGYIFLEKLSGYFWRRNRVMQIHCRNIFSWTTTMSDVPICLSFLCARQLSDLFINAIPAEKISVRKEFERLAIKIWRFYYIWGMILTLLKLLDQIILLMTRRENKICLVMKVKVSTNKYQLKLISTFIFLFIYKANRDKNIQFKCQD